jgi:hypothetical protein
MGVSFPEMAAHRINEELVYSTTRVLRIISSLGGSRV